MSVYMVTYDLNAPGQNYRPLIEAIERYNHCKALKSAYFIDTSRPVGAVRDDLMKLIDKNDTLFVIDLKNNWGANRHTQATQWLQNTSRTWS